MMLLFWLLAASTAPTDVPSNWQRVGQGKDGTAFFVDDSTIQLQSPGTFKVWTRRDEVPGGKYSHENVLISLDCSKRTSKYEAAISYLPDGSVGNDRYKPERRFLPISPNSMDWMTMERVCRLAQPSGNH